MRVEEFKKMSDDALVEKANECFAEIDTLDDPHRPQRDTPLLLQAQFYVNEADRRASARHDAKIAKRDLLLDLIIIALIGLEIVIGFWEGSRQAAILSQLNASTSATANTLRSLDRSASATASILETLRTTQESQLRILESEYEAQGKHPILQVRALSWQMHPVPPPQGYKPTLLDANKVSPPVNIVAQSPVSSRAVEADFVLRNVGSAPAVNVMIGPQPSSGVSVSCVDYPTVYPGPQESKVCEVPSGNIPPIPPRPKNHIARTSQAVPMAPGETFDPDFDVEVRVNMKVPPNINEFDLALTVSADGVTATRYIVQCRVPAFH
jgi:hypothetical protein